MKALSLRWLRAGATILVAMLAAHPALAARWVVDQDNSTLAFEAQVYGSAMPGHFDDWRAEIDFDAEALGTSNVRVVIEMTSAQTADETRTQALKGPDWFANAEYPTAELVSTGFTRTGDDAFEMAADLTLRGNTVPVVLPFTLTSTADGTRAVGALTIDRTQFGVGQGDFVTGSIVGLDVVISIDVRAAPAP